MKTLMCSLFALSVATAGMAVAQQNTAKDAAQNQNKGQSSQRATPGNQNGDVPIVLTVTTVAFAESTGCWAKIYDGHNYTGRTLTLMGGHALPHLEFGPGYDWEGDIDSAQVGPKATLTLYEEERFGEKKRELKAGEKVADLHKSVLSEGVESLTLTCTQD